jgi:dienelactone hydrolase
MQMRTQTAILCAVAALTVLSASGYPRASANAAAETAASNSVVTDLQEWHDAKRNRTLPVKLYLPAAKQPGPSPILIFSHGLGGSRDAAQYLGEYLANKGYICVHVQHPGSDTEVARAAILSSQGGQSSGGKIGTQGGFQGRLAALKEMRSGLGNAKFSGVRAELGKAANGQNLVLRVQDVSFVIDELERRNKSDPLLANRLDLSKIAVAGHSFGAGTSLAICGQNYGTAASPRTATDPRVKAGIYLSAPVNLHGRPLSDVYGQIKVPGLLMTGTEDSSPIGNTDASARRIPFDGITAPHQYLVNFIGGDHAIFGGRSFRPGKAGDEGFHEQINQIAGAFLDAYLRGDKAAQAWLDGNGATKYFAKSAKFERK